jgi:hypothetical protein
MLSFQERCAKETAAIREVIATCKSELQRTDDLRYRAILMTELECHLKTLENVNSIHSAQIKDLDGSSSDAEFQSRTSKACCRSGRSMAVSESHHSSGLLESGSTGSLPFHIWQHLVELEIPMYGKDHGTILALISSSCRVLRRLYTECWAADRARPHVPGQAWLVPGMVLGRGVLKQPWGVAVDREGRILVADRGHHRVVIFGPDGSISPLVPNPATCRHSHPILLHLDACSSPVTAYYASSRLISCTRMLTDSPACKTNMITGNNLDRSMRGSPS